MYSLRIIAAIIALVVILTCLTLISFAADTSAMAKASYLPDELKQLPPQVEVVSDTSGYWAGDGTTLIRCIEIERLFSRLEVGEETPPSDLEPLEVLKGVTIGNNGERDMLLFYYLDDEGEWQRLGFMAYNWIRSIIPVDVGYANDFYLKADVGNGGNSRSQKGVCCFVFWRHPDGTITYRDKAPSIEGIQTVDLYPEHSWTSPVYVMYPTMGTHWETDLPFYHFANPDRYILLADDDEGGLENVSSRYPDFYMEMLGRDGYLEIQQSAALGKPVNRPTEDEDFLPLIIQTLIYFYDMGYPEEGIRLARSAAKAYGYKEYEGKSVESIITEIVSRLNAQDKLIQDAIDKYNAEISAASW
jgi:hypothetical protein